MAGVSYFHLDESLEPLLEEEMWTGTEFFFFFFQMQLCSPPDLLMFCQLAATSDIGNWRLD